MGRSAIEQLLWMMDSAFEGDPAKPTQSWHAVLVNLASSPRDEWDWAPPGGARTIFSLVRELGVCKLVYDNQAFGDGSMDWDVPGTVPAIGTTATYDGVVAWLRDAHGRLRGHVAELKDDAQLLEPRPGPFGDGRSYETRWLVNTMIQHDLYHAGEINHIRALRQRNDGPGND